VTDGRRGLERRCSLLLVVITACAFLIPFGCAPKKVRVYDSLPTVGGRDGLIEYAITLLGKPYRSGGKGPNAFDCSGLVYHVYQRFDATVPLSTEGLARIGREVSREDMAAGDLAVFRLKGGLHVGIMINALEFIHASSSRGVAIDSIDFPYWKRSFSHFRRIL
jgi:cell wall-associated NlpC family hydrolase